MNKCCDLDRKPKIQVPKQGSELNKGCVSRTKLRQSQADELNKYNRKKLCLS